MRLRRDGSGGWRGKARLIEVIFRLGRHRSRPSRRSSRMSHRALPIGSCSIGNRVDDSAGVVENVGPKAAIRPTSSPKLSRSLRKTAIS